MNSTKISHTVISNDYLTVALTILLIVSEVLPLISKTKGNGLLDSCICLLKGSKCMIDTTLKAIIPNEDIESNNK